MKEIIVIPNYIGTNEGPSIVFIDPMECFKTNFFDFWIKSPMFSQKKHGWFDMMVCLLIVRGCNAANEGAVGKRVSDYCEATNDQAELAEILSLIDEDSRGAVVFKAYIATVRYAYCLDTLEGDTHQKNVDTLAGADIFMKQAFMMIDEKELIRLIEFFEMSTGIMFKDHL